MFLPHDYDPKYDVVFIANGTQKNLKGHKWFLEQMDGSGLKILQMGFPDKEIIEYANNFNIDIYKVTSNLQ